MPGSLPDSPAKIMAKLLVDLTLGTTPPTPPAMGDPWPVYYDNEPSKPNELIAVNDTSGIVFKGDSHGGRNEHHGLQILVRGGTHDIGWPKADAVKHAMDQFKTIAPRIVTVGDNEYCVGQIRRTGGIMRLGPEGNTTRRRYTINVLAYIILYDG